MLVGICLSLDLSRAKAKKRIQMQVTNLAGLGYTSKGVKN